MTSRIFVAVPLDAQTRARCAEVAERLRGAGWLGRWVPPANYHLTAAFLGAVDEARIPEVLDAVRGTTAGTPRFAIELARLGGFPTALRPRVVWLGPAATSPPFAALCGAIRNALGAHGFPFEQDAAPHVTLARADGTAALPPLAVPPTRLEVDAVVVYRSILDPKPTRHEPIERFPLAG